MQLLYIDEAGMANPYHEPYMVVAGVLVHVDDKYESIRKYLLDMADDLVAPNNERPANFCFQAKQLWHGEGFFDREKFTLQQRLEILGHLAEIPQKFGLPVIYSCLERKIFLEQPFESMKKGARAEFNSKCHATCFADCLSRADSWVAEHLPGEKVLCVVENHEKHRGSLKLVAELLADPRAWDQIEADDEFHFKPLRKLVETPLFSPKSGTSPLQIADTVAFILARALAGSEHTDELLKKIEPQLAHGLTREFFRHG